MGLLLCGASNLATAETKSEVFMLPLFSPAKSPSSLCLVKGLRKKVDYQQWVKTELRITQENLTHVV